MDTKTAAIEVMAEHLARKAAKRADTESARFVEGYKQAVIDIAVDPLPTEIEMIAVVARSAEWTAPEPTTTKTGEG